MHAFGCRRRLCLTCASELKLRPNLKLAEGCVHSDHVFVLPKAVSYSARSPTMDLGESCLKRQLMGLEIGRPEVSVLTGNSTGER